MHFLVDTALFNLNFLSLAHISVRVDRKKKTKSQCSVTVGSARWPETNVKT